MVAGSIVAAAAPNFTVFLVGRALQGLTYGIVPVTIAQARRYLSDKNMRYGISSESVTVANGLGDGYPSTGILGDLLGLRFALWFAALFTRLAGAVVWRIVPGGRDEHALSVPFDIWGALLVGTGLACLLVTVGEDGRWGWTFPVDRPHPTATGISTALTLDAPACAAVSVALVTNRVTAPHPPSVALESTRFDPPASRRPHRHP